MNDLLEHSSLWDTLSLVAIFFCPTTYPGFCSRGLACHLPCLDLDYTWRVRRRRNILLAADLLRPYSSSFNFIIFYLIGRSIIILGALDRETIHESPGNDTLSIYVFFFPLVDNFLGLVLLRFIYPTELKSPSTAYEVEPWSKLFLIYTLAFLFVTFLLLFFLFQFILAQV